MNERLKESIIHLARQIEVCAGEIQRIVNNIPDKCPFQATITNASYMVEESSWSIIASSTKMLVQLFKGIQKNLDDGTESKQIAGTYVLDIISQIMLILFGVEEAMSTWVSGITNDASKKATEKLIDELSSTTEALIKSLRFNILERKI